jgi:hypothetical protein
MPLNLASPGIVVREVDLTIGRIDPLSGSVAALVAPFAQGPVNLPTTINNESDLYNVFGKPYGTDKQYEDWLVASSYLAYGGTLQVVRAADPDLKNAFVGTASSVVILNGENYTQLGYSENDITNVTFAAKNPGSWANGIKVAVVDQQADQILTGISTTNILVGYGFTQAIASGTVLPGVGSTTVLNGYYFKGIITQVGTGQVSTKIVSIVDSNNVESAVDYQIGSVYSLSATGSIGVHTNGYAATFANRSYTGSTDWYDQQYIQLTTGTIPWNSIAPRPSTSAYSQTRGGRFDQLHVVVVDDSGAITGNSGTILEKHLSLSKASDAQFSVGATSFWRKYLEVNSQYIYGGSAPVGIVTTGFDPSNSANYALTSTGGWDQNASNIVFSTTGANSYTLSGGTNYDGLSNLNNVGSLNPTLANINTGYLLFQNTELYKINFLLMGSSNYPKETAQALANQLISIAEYRKDAIAFISPYRQAFLNDSAVGTVTVNSSDTITNNVTGFFSAVTSSTYAVFDSGYKYMYDRFNGVFRYVPLNGDVAGCCARNDINQFPWFSPAGTTRGTILNAVKLAYSPNRSQRDELYTNRVNPVILSPGSGIILFGDKTGYAKASAFDRINVRRLFIYLENAISAAAKDQLFEFNDEITRTNFVNIIEPFLRDVQSKRGIFDYVVICDQTNNTAAVIDANEFVADIYIKPARSINFIGLTFIATRTGVAFEEVIGKV